MNAMHYPDVRVGDDVIFTTDPHATDCQWRLGQVRVAKTNSCDIVVFNDTGIEYRHDCLHRDDPRIESTKIWAEPGRGMFRLAPCELERRRLPSLVAELSQKVDRLAKVVDLQSDANTSGLADISARALNDRIVELELAIAKMQQPQVADPARKGFAKVR